MRFKDIIGQEDVVQHLIKSKNTGRISHTMLFAGPNGSGKLALALAFAQYITCENPKDNDSCGTCKSCKAFEKLEHPDLHLTFPVISKPGITKPTSNDYISKFKEIFHENPYFSYVDWINKLDGQKKQAGIFVHENEPLMQQLSLKSFMGGYKVFIIWMMEKVNNQTANKILKSLEEPPPKTIFILIADRTELILPTIISRAQLIRTQKIKKEEIKEGLINKYNVEKYEAERISHLADGDFNKAISLINNLEILDQNLTLFQGLMRAAYQFNMTELTKTINILKDISRDNLNEFLNYFLFIIRNNMLLNIQLDSLTHLSDAELEFSKKFSKLITPEKAGLIAHEVELCIKHIGRNVNTKIVLYDLSFRIYEILTNIVTL